MTENFRTSAKDVDETIQRDRQEFLTAPYNLYGDETFQIETKYPAEFAAVSYQSASRFKRVLTGAFVLVAASLLTGFLLGNMYGQQTVFSQDNQQVLGVNENLYQD